MPARSRLEGEEGVGGIDTSSPGVDFGRGLSEEGGGGDAGGNRPCVGNRKGIVA